MKKNADYGQLGWQQVWVDGDGRMWDVLANSRWYTNNKNGPLHIPHYTENEFNHAVDLYGKDVKGLEWVYSDRLWEWDYDKAEAANKVAAESGTPVRSAAYYEVYLSAYFGKPVELVGVKGGCNVASGFHYYVFGYRDKNVGEPKI